VKKRAVKATALAGIPKVIHVVAESYIHSLLLFKYPEKRQIDIPGSRFDVLSKI